MRSTLISVRCTTLRSSSCSVRSCIPLVPITAHIQKTAPWLAVHTQYKRTLSASPSQPKPSSSNSGNMSSVDRDLAELMAIENRLKDEAKARNKASHEENARASSTLRHAVTSTGDSAAAISLVFEAPSFWKSIQLTKKLSFTGFVCAHHHFLVSSMYVHVV